jgi:putative toxin-antitoxin system antitoxin component (TIGR02293 family)
MDTKPPKHKHVRRAVGQVATILDELFEGGVVDGPDVARVLGTSPRSVARWHRTGATPRRDTEERLAELKAVVDLLRTVLRDEPARLWLRSPNPELGYEKPIDLIERGEYRRVIGALLALAEGVTA